MLKATKSGENPACRGPSGCHPTISHTGPLPVATVAGAHFHPFAPAEKTALKPVHPLLRAQLCQPALREPSFMPLPWASGSQLPPPARPGSPVHEIWVPGQLLSPRDPGFPVQNQRSSSWRFILTSGQFRGRHIQVLRNDTHLQTGQPAPRSGLPACHRAGRGNLKQGRQPAWGQRLSDTHRATPTRLQLPGRHRTAGITSRRDQSSFLLCRQPFGSPWMLASPGLPQPTFLRHPG